MVVDLDGLQVPRDPWILELSNQLLFLGIDTDNGEPVRRRILAQFGDALELSIAYLGCDCGRPG